MSKENIFVGDEGVMLELEFRDYEIIDNVKTDIGPLDISAAAEITFLTTKPDGTKAADKTKTAAQVALTTDGTDGKANYLTEAAFLDQPGAWKRQGKVAIGAGTHHSEIVSFVVKSPL